MRKTALIGIIAALLTLGTGGICWGSLLSKDFVPGGGDGLITYDSGTGLEWLDLSETAGISYATITSGYGGYLSSHGFRYASDWELHDLYVHAGLDVLGWGTNYASYYSINADGVQALLDLMGSTFDLGLGFSIATGMYGQPASDIVSAATIHWNPSNDEAWAAITGPQQQFQSLSVANSSVASYLVRDSAVPLPGAVFFFGSGIAGLLGFKRWRRKQ